MARVGQAAQFTHTAFSLIKINRHFRSYDGKGVGRADGRTGTAMGTSFFNALYLLSHIQNLYTPLLEIFYAFLEVFSASGEFQHHHPFFSGEYGSIENVEGQVKIL
jgi:hypothetical protein